MSASAQLFQHRRDCRRVFLQVGVDGEQVLPPRGAEARRIRLRLAQPLRMAQPAYASVRLRRPLNDRPTAVVAAVVDEQNLPRFACALQRVGARLQQARQVRRFVVQRRNQAQRGGIHR
jgi:hypothetical protein